MEDCVSILTTVISERINVFSHTNQFRCVQAVSPEVLDASS